MGEDRHSDISARGLRFNRADLQPAACCPSTRMTCIATAGIATAAIAAGCLADSGTTTMAMSLVTEAATYLPGLTHH